MARHSSRNSRRWAQLSARLRRELPPVCYLCGSEIDLELPRRHPLSWTLDHIVPLAHGGEAYDESNLRPAHMRCNSQRGTGRKIKGTQNNSRRWLFALGAAESLAHELNHGLYF